MKQITDLILSTFQSSKENGSYFLFYILALGLGLAIAWDRYVKEETEDNWMLEEAKQKIQLWPFLYGLLGLILIVANPAVIWIFNKITPLGGQYYKVWPLLLVLFISAYGMVCFLSLLREQKQKTVVLIGFIVLIGLSGNAYGLMADRQSHGDFSAEQKVAEYILKEGKGGLVLAAEPVLEYVGVYQPKIDVLYGKDLYTPNMDLGIMDVYSEELLGLYEAVKNPKESLEQLTAMAWLYDCDILVLPSFEDSPDKAGNYEKKEVIEPYTVYMR